MNTTIARYILKIITYLRKQPLVSSISFLEESQWWTESEIRKYQNAKLAKLMLHCQHNTLFYKDFFADNKIDSQDITIANLHSLPLISKEFLRTNLDSLVDKSNLLASEKAKTSGSTGIALQFPKSLLSTAIQYAAMYRGHKWHGVEIGEKEARLWGIPVNKFDRMKVLLFDIFLNRFREDEYNLEPNVLINFTKKIKKKKPKYLMGYTSMVSQYAIFLKNNSIDMSNLNLKMVKCTSETINVWEREIIEDVFNCPLVSEYGAAETGLIAFQCEKGSQHIMSDCVIVEYLDPEENLDDPRLKEIVVTNLDNFALPIVRYRVGDFVIPSEEKCSCGRDLPIIDKIVGRVSNVIQGENGKRWHSIILYYIMKSYENDIGGVVQFKVIQDSINELSFFLITDSPFTKASELYIKNKCRETFGESMHIHLRVVTSLPRELSGKLRDFVPLSG
jgi:phenylacetate-CoA ligase